MKEGYLYLIVSNEDQDEPGEQFHFHPLGELVECVRAPLHGEGGDTERQDGHRQIVYPEHVVEIGEI